MGAICFVACDGRVAISAGLIFVVRGGRAVLGVFGLIIPYCVGYIRRSTSTGGVHFVSSGVILAGRREGLKVFV